MTQKKKHTLGVVFMFQCFAFFLISAFACLGFSSVPLLLDFEA